MDVTLGTEYETVIKFKIFIYHCVKIDQLCIKFISELGQYTKASIWNLASSIIKGMLQLHIQTSQVDIS